MTSRRYPLESLFGKILSPFELFLRRTTAGGIVLVATTLVALCLATTIGGDLVEAFWEQRVGVLTDAGFGLNLSLRHWVNDAAMAFFFLLVGLELKREMLVGELSSGKDAILPIVAALGGMIVPALFYVALNWKLGTSSGWAISMATDIAFAVGILVLLGQRIPRNLIVFLTALAIADDLGAVLVIAIFYTPSLDTRWLYPAALLALMLLLLNRGGIRNALPYAIVGALLWYALHGSGLHATIAGMLLAIAIPARGTHAPPEFERHLDDLRNAFHADRLDTSTPDDPLSNSRMAYIAQTMEHSAIAVQSPLQRMEHSLTPWVTFVVIPIFALANAGIDITAIEWRNAFSNRVTLGVAAGLAIGKFSGIGLFSWIAVRAGWARLPSNVEWRHLLGAAWLAGIGFTMSLFIAQLAFGDADNVEQAKLGILLASTLSAAVGLCWLYVTSSPARSGQ